jgi:hypothetical protein
MTSAGIGDLGKQHQLDLGRPCCSHDYKKDHAIYAVGRDWTITNNIIYNIYSGWHVKVSEHWDGSMSGPTHIITNNLFAGDVNDGLQSGCYDTAHGAIWWTSGKGWTQSHDVIVENNVFYNTPGTYAMRRAGSTDMDSAVIRNNVATAPDGMVDGLDGESPTLSGNLLGVAGDMGMVDPDNNDFRLTASATDLIDSGLVDNAPGLDFEGLSRPVGLGIDIGPYEYLSGEPYCGDRDCLPPENCSSCELDCSPCANGSGVFSDVDTFLGNADNWEPLNPGRWQVIQDQSDMRYGITDPDFRQAAPGMLGEYSLVKGKSYDDFVFQAKARTTENLATEKSADLDVVFGYQDSDNYYYVMFNSDPEKDGLQKVVDGSMTGIDDLSGVSIADNDYHDVMVKHIGEDIMVYFDSVLVLQTTDQAFSSGRVGIGGFNDASLWDDIIVKEIHRSDLDKNGCVLMNELVSFIDLWKSPSGGVAMPELMEAIGRYSSGQGCA